MKTQILLVLVMMAFFNLVHAKDKITVTPVGQAFISNGTATFKIQAPQKIIIEKAEFALFNQKGNPVSTPLKWNNTDIKSLDQIHTVSFPIKLDEGQYKVHFKMSGFYEKDKKNNQGKWNENPQVFFNVKKGVVDPGEEGKKTLEGIDVDQDGIRDDIQVWIDSEYPMETKPNTNKALKQYSKYMQLAIINYQNEVISKSYKVKNLEAFSCLRWIVKNVTPIYKKHDSKFLNTSERIRAELKAESYFNGLGRPESIKNIPINQRNVLCEFNASKE